MTRSGAIAATAALICSAVAVCGDATADEAAVNAALARRPFTTAVGVSSYYGPGFYGRPTATGEIFEMRGLTAAHKTLPIPSYARVTNLHNGRSVIVRINDRGPYVGGRMLDVSERVAHLLAFKGGLERVRLDYLGMAGPAGSEDQRALLASLKTGAESVVVAKVKPPVDDGVSSVARTEPALAYAGGARAPAAAALDAVRPPSPPPAKPIESLGLAAKLDASARQLQAALEAAHGAAKSVANAISPYGQLVVAPFTPLTDPPR